MGTNSVEKRFNCGQDCNGYRGCPGHVMRADYFRTSDIFSFDIDGERQATLDHEALEALLDLVEALRGPVAAVAHISPSADGVTYL